MRHLSSFMQNEVVLALGWTLLHSLWQGLLLAIVTGTMLLVTRRSHSQKRYELLTGLFLLFIAVTGMTFARELYIAIAHPHYRPLANIAAGRSVISTFIPFTESHIAVNRSWASRLKEYFNQHAYLIVTIWFIIFMARFIKLIAELAYIQRLKTYRTSEPPQAWKNRLQELMNKMSVNVYVQLLESGLVKVPVVMGILKPVILLPFGLLSQLPPDEIEAILLHELAHIRRRDYFVNLLQSFAETLFFFNPALMWLSSLIREERENCCDDIAIAVTNNKTKYIDALISFQEFNLTKPSFTMGFPGKKYQLLNRVKRIITKRNTTLNTTEKSILTLSIATLIMLSFVAAKNIPISKVRKRITEHNASVTSASNDVVQKSTFSFQPREKAEIVGSFGMSTGYQPVFHDEVIDTIPVAAQEIRASGSVQNDTAFHFKHYSTDISSDGNVNTLIINAVQQNGTIYRLKKIGDRIIEFNINDKSINEADFAKYEEQITAVERPYRAKRAKTEIDRERSQLMHEWDVIREKLATLNKDEAMKVRASGPKRMRNVDGKWELVVDSLTKTEYLYKQDELNKKISELDKIMIEGDERRKDLPYFKTIKIDTIRFKTSTFHQTEKVNTSSKLFTQNKIDVTRKAETVELQKKAEMLKRELSETQEKLLRLQKQDAIKKQQDQKLIDLRKIAHPQS